jgi:hypothetical protein
VNKVVVQCLQYALDNISTDSSDDKKWFLTALQSAVLFFARYHRFVYIFKWYDIFHITIQMLTYANEDRHRYFTIVTSNFLSSDYSISHISHFFKRFWIFIIHFRKFLRFSAQKHNENKRLNNRLFRLSSIIILYSSPFTVPLHLKTLIYFPIH